MINLTDLSVQEARQTALARLSADRLRNVDVGDCQSLCRFRLYRISSSEHLFCIEAHHTYVDGTSWGLLADEVSMCYGAFSAQHEPLGLPVLPMQFTDWAMRELRKYTRPATCQALVSLVETVIRGGENRGTTLPVDAPRDLQHGWWDEMRRHRHIDLVLDSSDIAAINATARTRGQTPFVALAAVIHAWQFFLTGKTDLSLMVTLSGRTDSASQ
eukprot:SAG11_NODE_11738_length_741_cov_0.607477_1_plen_214_part_10